MSGIQEFVCYECSKFWRDKYSFWRGYQSPCPACGKPCKAACDSPVFADQNEWKGFYEAPVFDFEEDELEKTKTEADLEAERDVIHDEIAEALGAVEADTSDADADDDDADADSEADAGDQGF